MKTDSASTFDKLIYGPSIFRWQAKSCYKLPYFFSTIPVRCNRNTCPCRCDHNGIVSQSIIRWCWLAKVSKHTIVFHAVEFFMLWKMFRWKFCANTVSPDRYNMDVIRKFQENFFVDNISHKLKVHQNVRTFEVSLSWWQKTVKMEWVSTITF